MSIQVNGMTPLISVFNMPRALAFYRDTLGFAVVADSGNGDISRSMHRRLLRLDFYPLGSKDQRRSDQGIG